jgi:stress response protein YsnF
MNSQVMAKNIKQTNSTERTRALLENLRTKVKYFVVFDRQGRLVGEVQDLIVDASGQLNLVISKKANLQVIEQRDFTGKSPLLLLQSQKIKKIDKSAKSVFIEIDQSEIEYMPEYSETATPGDQNLSMNSTELPTNGQITNSSIEISEDVGEEKIIRLLEERLLIDNKKRRVGEVIVRKEIETRMVEVPVRREILIVEQVSPEHKQLAEIDLGQGEISGIELTESERLQLTNFAGSLTVNGEFSSPKIASLLLNAIALEHNHGCKQVRVTITVEDESQQKRYQEWFDRCSKGQIPKPDK